MSNLITKKCQPCEGEVPPLTKEQADEYLKETPGWGISSDYKKISREFKFKDFAGALAFVNKIGALAEEEGHHPDILLHGYRKVRVELTTHAISGLSENDFILAAKINALD